MHDISDVSSLSSQAESPELSFDDPQLDSSDRLELDFKESDIAMKRDDSVYAAHWTCTRKFFYYLEIIYRALMVAAVAAAMVIFLISFYCVIIINFVFFVSSIISYVLSPLYRGLCRDWVQLGYSMIQCIVTCPYVQFYILFILSSVKQFSDSLPSFWNVIVMVWEKTASKDHISRYEPWYKTGKDWGLLKKLLRSLFAVLISLSLFAGAWFFKKWSITLGMFPYLAIVVQIISRVLPVYRFWWQFIWKGKIEVKNKNNWLNHFVNDLADWIDDMKKRKKKSISSTEAQTYESVFVGKVTEHLYIPDLSYSSEGVHSNWSEEVEQQGTAKSGKQKEREERQEQDNMNQHNDFWDSIADVFLALVYKKLYKLGISIVNDTINPGLNRVVLIIFTLVNILTIVYDIYRCTTIISGYFIVSIIMRILFLPLASYFHFLVVVLNKVKNATLKGVMWVGFVFTILVIVASIAGVVVAQFYMDTERIVDLPAPTAKDLSYNWNHTGLSAPICAQTFNGLTVVEAIGLALGPYDVKRNSTVFNNQMSHFFGSNWADKIDYKVEWITNEVPMVVYHLKEENMTVFGFRGFTSGPELAFQIEMLAIHYALPFFQDMVPLLGYMVDWFIEFYTIFAHNFGFHFFDPTSMINDFMDPILELCLEYKVRDTENVLFTGVNVGGIFAKVAGMVTHRPALGFITLPSYNDFFTWTFDLEEESTMFITNVYNYGGMFCSPEPDTANNLGIASVPISTFSKDAVYPSFCTIVEACRLNEKYGEYCDAVIGDSMNTVREFFNQDTFDMKY